MTIHFPGKAGLLSPAAQPLARIATLHRSFPSTSHTHRFGRIALIGRPLRTCTPLKSELRFDQFSALHCVSPSSSLKSFFGASVRAQITSHLRSTLPPSHPSRSAHSHSTFVIIALLRRHHGRKTRFARAQEPAPGADRVHGEYVHAAQRIASIASIASRRLTTSRRGNLDRATSPWPDEPSGQAWNRWRDERDKK